MKKGIFVLLLDSKVSFHNCLMYLPISWEIFRRAEICYNTAVLSKTLLRPWFCHNCLLDVCQSTSQYYFNKCIRWTVKLISVLIDPTISPAHQPSYINTLVVIECIFLLSTSAASHSNSSWTLGWKLSKVDDLCFFRSSRGFSYTFFQWHFTLQASNAYYLSKQVWNRFHHNVLCSKDRCKTIS